MKLSSLRNYLQTITEIQISKPDGNLIPSHFHITEAGLLIKEFIDCGGKKRNEKLVSLQIWVNNDIQHRLSPEKLLKIIAISEKLFGENDLEIEVEYQLETIGKFGLEICENSLKLTVKNTACLAQEECGLPKSSKELKSFELPVLTNSCCSSESVCC